MRADSLIDLERFDEAIATLRPGDRARSGRRSRRKWNKSLICLGLGRFKEGWALYEHRWAGAEGTGATLLTVSRAGTADALDGTAAGLGRAGSRRRNPAFQHAAGPDCAHRCGRAGGRAAAGRPCSRDRFPTVKVIPFRRRRSIAGRSTAQDPIGSLGRLLPDRLGRRSRAAHAAIWWPPISRVRRPCARGLRRTDGAVVGLSWISKAPVGGESEERDVADFANAAARSPDAVSSTCNTAIRGPSARRRSGTSGIRVEHLADIDNMNDIDGLAALITACDVCRDGEQHDGAPGRRARPAHLGDGAARTRAASGTGSSEGDDSPWYPRVHVRRQKPMQSWSDLVASFTDEVAAHIGGRRNDA